mgnify:CR=1 FL=1
MAVSSRKSSDANDFSMEEKIVALYELQKIDSKIDEINKLKGELPLEVQDLEDEIAGLDTRIANITAEVDELNKATKQYKDAIDQSKTLIAKYEGQQDNVRNNREFDGNLQGDGGVDSPVPESCCEDRRPPVGSL